MRSPGSPSRWRVQWRQVLALTIAWLALVGRIDVVTVGGGFLIGWLITVIFPLPPVAFAGRLHPWAGARLALVLLRDLAVASVSLARFAFGRRLPSTAIVRVRLRSDSDLYQVAVSLLNTIVPGTIVLDARRRTRTLYLHVFDATGPEQLRAVVEDALDTERRVVRALGSRAEIAEVERRVEEAR